LLLVLVVVYVPFLNPIFKTVPLAWQQWQLLLPLLVVPSVVAELVKWFSYTHGKKTRLA